ncbi:peptide deformylase [Acidocella sp. KAb 2-4]|uniref:peptide deformylase n=1 Tax=Acidocella sp. KAb 2-4 TaxID=2885158 RepID=UPI001D07815D|nr:peptide deformylase [Acidocella sp. KAb 2-4]MCB5944453.1 peptide deformylase [Acidocella sp. KAb 2-4]
MLETHSEAELLPILICPDPKLRKAARAVTPDDAEELRELIPDMFATMYKAPGIGLAAPQVGRLLRVITVDVAPNDEPAPIALINPEIIAKSEETAVHQEGCLSVPDQYAEVTRPARVAVRYLDENWTKREIEADGLLSACLQHEIDHLNGVLFVDYLTPLKRNILLRKLAKAQKDKK